MGSRRVPYVPQMEIMECGAACLAMILGHWGHHASLPAIREACKVSREGANAANILAAARHYQLEAEAVSVAIQDLDHLPLPAILHWEFKHFVVLERRAAKGVFILDPAQGPRFVTWTDLRRCFTGVALVFARAEGFQTRPRKTFSMKRYLYVLQGLQPTLWQLLGTSFMLQCAGLVLPVANQLLVDWVILPRYLPWLWGLALALTLAMVTQMLLSLLRSYVLQGLQATLDQKLTEGFVGHLISLPMFFFFQRQGGDLLQRVESNTQIRDLLSTHSLAAILDTFLLAGYFSLMMAYDVTLAALVTALGCLQVFGLLALRRRNQQLTSTELALQGQENAILVEVLQGLETVKASGAQDFSLGRWASHMIRRVNANMKRARLDLALGQSQAVAQGFCSGAVLYLGGKAVLEQRMSLGVLVAFLTLQGLFMVPLASLLNACSELNRLGSHFMRLDDVLDTAPEACGSLVPGRLRGDIRLEKVCFQYAEGSPWILRSLSITIGAGEKVALVGQAGAGKSTLARLLLGMLPPTHGKIYFDGMDLATLDLAPFRSQLGVVLQESFLFDDTVEANLRLQAPDVSMEAIYWATQLTQIHDVVQGLPHGYGTQLGENAAILSGGERQRLCLARAVARKPAILLLDEATSALDLETERSVHQGLAGLGCTRIVIAHRLETLKDADRILVLEQGVIQAEGTYEELAARPGLFQDMVRARESSLD